MSFRTLRRFRPNQLRSSQTGSLPSTSATKNNFPDAAAQGFVNVKAQGNQWNWTYSYPDIVDADGFPLEFVSNGIHKGTSADPTDTDLRPRNLAVDYPMVIPAGRYVRYYTAAADVIHSWTVPAFGVKTDAVPGRLNEGWFLVDEPGVYYGQCSELCGRCLGRIDDGWRL